MREEAAADRGVQRSRDVQVTAPAARIERLLTAAYVAFVTAFVGWVCWTTLRDHYTTPYGDDWRFLDGLFAGTHGDWYLAPHNGHRVPLTLLLIALDYRHFGGHMHLVVGAMLAGISLAAAALAAAWRPCTLRHPAFLFAIFTLFWAASYFDLRWSTSHCGTLAVLWLTVAIAALARDQRARTAGGSGSAGALVLAGLAAVAATFSFGSGIAVFGVLVVVGLLGRLPLRWVAAFVVLGVATGLVFSSGLEHVHGGSFLRLAPLPRLTAIAVSFVGGPVGTAAGALAGLDVAGRWRVALGAGALGLVVGLGWAVAVVRRGGRLTGAEVLGLGGMTFAFVTGCLVALGRSATWDVGVNSRFTLPAALFWIGLAAATAGLWARLVPATLLVVASVLMLPAVREARIEQARVQEILDLTAALHLLDLRADAETRGTLVQKSPDQVYRVVDRLRRDGRAMFAGPYAGLDGTPLASHFTVDDAAGCSGTARLTTLETRSGRVGARLGGHALDPAGTPVSIVVTDPGGIIRGLGAFTPIMHARFAASAPPADGVPYRGFIADFDAPTAYQVWAVRAGGRTVCPIAVTLTGLKRE